MQFICVNTNAVKGIDYPCTFCKTAIGKSYTRDLTTGLIYHSHFCMDTHIEQSILCIEDAARKTS